MARITSTGDPVLWQTLYDMWLRDKKPHHVVSATQYYEAVITTSDAVVFDEVTQVSLYDSRSLTKSKPSSYTKLDG